MRYNFNGFTEKGNEALNNAIMSAERYGHTYIGTEHLLLGILMTENSVARAILLENNVNSSNVGQLVIKNSGRGMPTKLSPEHFTPRAKRIIESAIASAKQSNKDVVGTEHILIELLSEGDNYAIRYISELGANIPQITKKLIEVVGIMGYSPEPYMDGDETFENSKDGMKKDAQRRKSSTKLIDKFGHDLTDDARNNKLDPVIGRSDEVERVIQILCRRTKNNPCLIGEPGVGKTAIVEGLAQRIVAGNAPDILKNKRVIALDLTGMVAGTKYRGDFEERIKNIMNEAIESDDIILFIDEVHTIIGAGSAEGSVDAANILKPSLARGDLQVIGATTLSEYRKNIEKDSALERRFQPVTVGEPNEEDSISILMGLRDRYEEHHKVKITDEAIVAAVRLSSRYITDRFLPDKAIDLIDEAGSRVRLATSAAPDEIKNLEQEIEKLSEEKNSYISSQNFEKAAELRDKEKELNESLIEAKNKWITESKGYTGTVTENEIADIVSGWTGIPTGQLTEEESTRLLKMEDILHNRIVGQNEAVNAIAKAIRRGRVGLKDPKRPTGSFIFLGPTGVGKTELCKALAEAMFGSEDAMIRLDMSEYMEKHTVSRIVGSPPGYVGFEEGGQLTEKVRRKPYSVVLFDEIEKAHPDVFNLLLQILEDGMLTDSQGRRVDFKNTVVIMTSNIGARLITDKKTSFGFATADNADEALESDVKQDVLEELKKHFRPEFLNRVDDTIVFSKLGMEDIKQIAKNMLENLKKRLLNLEIDAEFDESAIEAIATAGFDNVYGARPLRRAIQARIEDALSEKILDGSIKKGDKITCSHNGTEFVFSNISTQ